MPSPSSMRTFNKPLPSFCWLTLYLLASTMVFGQAFLLNHPVRNQFSIRFNPAFIQAHHISIITKRITSKKDNAYIVDNGLIEQLKFDQQGNLLCGFHSFLNKAGQVDTTYFFYAFDREKRPIGIHESLPGCDLFKSTYYQYAPDGSISKIKVCRETNISVKLFSFSPGKSEVVSEESYKCEKINALQIKKQFLNDENRPYKEGIMYLDPAGRIKEESYAFVMAGIKDKTTYDYHSNGLLKEVISSSNDGYQLHEFYQYDFDKDSSLVGLHFFSNAIKTKDIAYIYSKTTGLVESEVMRDEKHADMEIIRYSYQFY